MIIECITNLDTKLYDTIERYMSSKNHELLDETITKIKTIKTFYCKESRYEDILYKFEIDEDWWYF